MFHTFKLDVTSIFAVVWIQHLQGRRCGLVVLVRARLVPQRVRLHRLIYELTYALTSDLDFFLA
jgi:hypothetical protein